MKKLFLYAFIVVLVPIAVYAGIIYSGTLSGNQSVGATVLKMTAGQATKFPTPFPTNRLLIRNTSGGAADETYLYVGVNPSGNSITISPGLLKEKYSSGSYTVYIFTPVFTSTPTNTPTTTATSTPTKTATATATTTATSTVTATPGTSNMAARISQNSFSLNGLINFIMSQFPSYTPTPVQGGF